MRILENSLVYGRVSSDTTSTTRTTGPRRHSATTKTSRECWTTSVDRSTTRTINSSVSTTPTDTRKTEPEITTDTAVDRGPVSAERQLCRLNY